MTDQRTRLSGLPIRRAPNSLRVLAYRMLGSLSEVDDAVQEAWLRPSPDATEPVAIGTRGSSRRVVKDRVNAIALAPAEDFRRDSDLFDEGMRTPESQSWIRAAMERGFQTRDMQMALARMVGDLADR